MAPLSTYIPKPKIWTYVESYFLNIFSSYCQVLLILFFKHVRYISFWKCLPEYPSPGEVPYSVNQDAIRRTETPVGIPAEGT